MLSIIAVYSQEIYNDELVLDSELSLDSSRMYLATKSIIFKSGFKFRAKKDSSGLKNIMLVAGHQVYPKINPIIYLSSKYDFANTNISTNKHGYNSGNISVLPDGSVSYNIDIPLPKGSGGMEPKLSLNYNSSFGNGVLGVGWTMSCFSSINRIGKVEYYDGKSSFLNLDTSDRLSLDGMRLININANAEYWSQEAVYVTSNNNRIRVFPIYSDNSLYGFRIENIGGDQIYYGNDYRTYVTASSVPIGWYISKIIDKDKNYIKFNYKVEIDEYWLDNIEYTGNEKTPVLEPYLMIQFRYARRKDIIERYIAGKKIPQSLLLNKIEVFEKNGQNRRLQKYELGYLFNNMSMLHTFTEFSRNGESKNNPIVFNYENDDLKNELEVKVQKLTRSDILDWKTNEDLTGYPDEHIARIDKKIYYMFGDFTGDGNQDRLVVCTDYELSHIEAYIEENLGYTDKMHSDEPIKIFENKSGRAAFSWHRRDVGDKLLLDRMMIADLNNDGYDDLIVPYFNEQANKRWKETIQNKYYHHKYLAFNVYLSDGVSLIKANTEPYGHQLLYSTDLANGNVQKRHTAFNFILADVDADGFIDLGLKFKEQYYNYYIWDDIIRLTDPKSWFSSDRPAYWLIKDGRQTFLNYYKFFDNDKKYISDDKRSDLNYDRNLMSCQEEFAAYIPFERDGSKGSEFLIFSESKGTEIFDGYLEQVAPTSWIPFRDIGYMWLDMNNDGYKDVIYSEKNNLYIQYNNGKNIESSIVFVCHDNGLFKSDPLGYHFVAYPQAYGISYSYPTGGYFRKCEEEASFINDFNADGYLDLLNYQVNYNKHTKKLYGSYTLYLNNGSRNFEKLVYNFENLDYDSDLILKGYVDEVSRFHLEPACNFYDNFKDKIVINCQPVNVSASGTQLFSYSGNGCLISFNTKKRGYKLVKVTDSYRKQNVVTYAPSSIKKIANDDFQFYYKADNLPLVYNNYVNVQNVGDLAIRLETYKNINEQLLEKSDYTYVAGIYDKSGKGFLGFREYVVNTYDHKGKSTIWSVDRLDETFNVMTPCSLSVLRNNQFIAETFYNIDYKDLQNRRYTVEHSSSCSNNYIDDTRIVNHKYFDDWGNCYNSITNIFDIKDNTKYHRNSISVEFDNSISTVNWSNKTLAKNIYSRLENDKGELRESLTSYDYYNDGKIASINYNKNRDTQQLAFFEYDKWGNVGRKYNKVRINDVLSDEFNLAKIFYEDKGRFVVEFKDLYDNTISFEYNDLYCDLAKITSPDGKFISFEYDDLGFPYKTVLSNGIELYNEISWTDDLIRAGQKTILKLKKTSTFGDELKLYYDYALNSISVDDKRYDINTSEIKEYKADNYYNWDGSLFKKTSQYKIDAEANEYSICEYDDFMRPLKHISYKDGQEVSTNQMDYSSLVSNRMIRLFDSENHQKFYKYDYLGNPVYCIDNFSNQVSFENNILGQTTKIKSPYLNQQEAYQINYKYDWYGNLLEMQSPDDGNYEYFYNEKNINYKSINPNGSIETQYYEDGNLKNIIITDKNGQSKTAEISYLEDFCGTKNVYVDQITYDGITYKDILSENYKEPLATTVSIDNRAFTFNYQYDNNIPDLKWGMLTNYTTPNASVKYEYNDKARLVRVESGGVSLWEPLKTNDYNSVVQFSRNNNSLIDNAIYDSYKMLVNYSSIANGNNIINMNFDMNHSNGVLNYKTEQISSKQLKETYLFDDLYRLTDISTFENNIQTSGPNVIDYYKDGSIKNKYDVGEYLYPTAVPGPLHVPKIVEANQMLPEFELQKISYTPFNSVETIETGIYKTKFYYGIDNQRIKSELYENNVLKKTKYYFPNYEFTDYHNGKTKEITYINDDGGAFAAKVKINENGVISEHLYYLHYDHVGSLIAVSDESNNVVGRMSFDTWGRMRNPENWTNIIADENTNNIYQIFERGYGFHEHMPEHNLINMNGRLYDPLLGQFIQPDSYIQFPDYSQSYNSYSYVLNNPAQYTDPSGEYLAISILIGMMDVYESIHAYNLGDSRAGEMRLANACLNFAGAIYESGETSIAYDPGADTPLEAAPRVNIYKYLPAAFSNNANQSNITKFNKEQIGYANIINKNIQKINPNSQGFVYVNKLFEKIGPAVKGIEPVIRMPIYTLGQQCWMNADENNKYNPFWYLLREPLSDLATYINNVTFNYTGYYLDITDIHTNICDQKQLFDAGVNTMVNIFPVFVEGTAVKNGLGPIFTKTLASGRKFDLLDNEFTNTASILSSTNFDDEVTYDPKNIDNQIEQKDDYSAPKRKVPCFISTTKVITNEGLKSIDSIKIGEFVFAYDISSNTNLNCNVENISKRLARDFRKIYFANDSIICTLEHPFFVNNVWVESKTLRAGDSLFSYDGKKLVIDSVNFYISDTSIYVYNLEVDGLRNYYVSASKVLVHNCDEMQIHHLLPVQFKPVFAALEFNIDDYTIKLPAWKHVLKPNGIHTVSGGNWNKVWDEFLKDPKNNNIISILKQMHKMIKEFGLEEYLKK